MRESETVEFKETTKELKQSVISMSSMLNKHGHGTVYFGIDNSGGICHKMMIGENTTRDISVIVRDNLRPVVTPYISIVNHEGGQVIKVDVSGCDAPYSAFGRYYIRSDDEDLQMTPLQLRQAFERSGDTQNRWEQQRSGHTLECVDESRLIDFIDQCNETGRLDYLYRDTQTTLSKLGLMYSENELNNAGYYLFSLSKPLKLKLAIFNTDERLGFSDIKQFDGNVFECIEEALKYIRSNIHWSAEIIGLKRMETPEIPTEAIREIVINSFAHMKYGSQPYNEIFLTPKRLSISNPGGLPEGKDPLSYAEGSSPSYLRNPLIANALYLNRSIDAFGTGFHRVFTVCSATGIGYTYAQDDYSFTFQFLRKPVNSPKTPIGAMTSDEMILLDLISTDPTLPISRMAEKTGSSEYRIIATINSLRKRGILVREGSKKNGLWIVVHRMGDRTSCRDPRQEVRPDHISRSSWAEGLFPDHVHPSESLITRTVARTIMINAMKNEIPGTSPHINKAKKTPMNGATE